uniref:Transmembrane protein n=1 Tax=Steinernema glaseri TaxID=37863 RepID=A0A1I7ZXE4_9BILA
MNQRFAATPPSPTRDNKNADFDDVEEGRGPAHLDRPSTGPIFPHGDGKEAGTSSGISAARFDTPTRTSREEDDSCLAQLKKIADCLRFKNGPHFQTLTNTNSPRGTLRPEEQQENETASMKIRNAHRRRIRKYVYYAQAALIAIVLSVYIGWRIIDYSRASTAPTNTTESPAFPLHASSIVTVPLSPMLELLPANVTDDFASTTPPPVKTVESSEERRKSPHKKMISAVAAKKNSGNLVEFPDSP